MALGADDEQAAGLTHFLCLGGDFRLVFPDELVVPLADGQNLRVVGFGEGVGLGQQVFVLLLLPQLSHGHILRVASQHNIRTTACHVGGDGDGTELTGLGDNLGFQLVELGVEHVVRDAHLLEHFAQELALFNGHGTHQHRLPLFVAGLHLLHNGPVLAGLGLIHRIRPVLPLHRAVGGNLHHVQPVDGLKFLGLRQSRTGHAGELVVKPEEILEGDGGQGLALPGDGHPLLGLDGLVQTLVVPAAVHETSGELVHNDDLTVLHHIVNVLLHETPGLHGLVDVVGEGSILGICQILHPEELLRLGNAGGGEGHGAGLLVHKVVAVVVVLDFLLIGLGKDLLPQTCHKGIRHLVELGGILPLAGDNQGGTGFINQDGVHLVHDGKGVAPLHQLLLVNGHVVPQVVKAQLVVGAVGDVGGIGLPPLGGGHARDNQAHGQTHILIDLAHPLGVTGGQVIVYRHHVDAPPGEGIEVAGQDGNQGLAFAGFHLGDSALMEDDAAHELHRIGAHPQHPAGCLGNGGKGLGKQGVQGLTLGQPLLELPGLVLQRLLGQSLILSPERKNLVHQGLNLLDFPLGAGAEHFCENSHSLTPCQWSDGILLLSHGLRSVLDEEQIGDDGIGDEKPLGGQMPAAVKGFLGQPLLPEGEKGLFQRGKGQQKPLLVYLGVHTGDGTQPHHDIFAGPLPGGHLLHFPQHLPAGGNAVNILLKAPDTGKTLPAEVGTGVRAEA